jgi:hypothetical protein
MRGVEGIVLRSKGGASKQKIKKSPAFELTRRLNSEFSGRSTASSWIMNMLFPLKALADYNIAGPLNALTKPVQMLDKESELGSRHILLSKNPAVLEGFSLNHQSPFESIVRAPLSAIVNKETFSAQVTIPALIHGINFMPAEKHPFYSFQVVLGVIPDLVSTPNGYQPAHSAFSNTGPASAATPWLPVAGSAEAITLALKLKTIPPDNAFTLMLSVGIRYGSVKAADTIEQVKYAGSAKVVMAA